MCLCVLRLVLCAVSVSTCCVCVCIWATGLRCARTRESFLCAAVLRGQQHPAARQRCDSDGSLAPGHSWEAWDTPTLLTFTVTTAGTTHTLQTHTHLRATHAAELCTNMGPCSCSHSGEQYVAKITCGEHMGARTRSHAYAFSSFSTHTRCFFCCFPLLSVSQSLSGRAQWFTTVWVSCFLHPLLSLRPTLYTHTSSSSTPPHPPNHFISNTHSLSFGGACSPLNVVLSFYCGHHTFNKMLSCL